MKYGDLSARDARGLLKYGDLFEKHDPAQSWWEMNDLLLLLEDREIDRVLEIGTHKGGSARVWRDALRPSILVTVNWSDEADGDMGGMLYFVGRRSQDSSLVSEVSEYAPYDMVFIDGGHYLDEVREDFDNFSPLARPGGLVVLHDVQVRDNPDCEVWRVWDSLGGEKTLLWDGVGSPGLGVWVAG